MVQVVDDTSQVKLTDTDVVVMSQVKITDTGVILVVDDMSQVKLYGHRCDSGGR